MLMMMRAVMRMRRTLALKQAIPSIQPRYEYHPTVCLLQVFCDSLQCMQGSIEHFMKLIHDHWGTDHNNSIIYINPVNAE
jgi:hypothetical protein